MTAYIAEKGEHCALCGTAPWEWDPKRGGDRRAYEAVERFCPGCYAKSSMRTMDPSRNMDGVTIELARNDLSQEAAQRHLAHRKRELKS